MAVEWNKRASGFAPVEPSARHAPVVRFSAHVSSSGVNDAPLAPALPPNKTSSFVAGL